MRIPDKDVIYSFKIVLAGTGGVGKTCLFNRYCFNSFNLDTKLTVSVNFHSTYLRFRQKNGDNGNEEKYVLNSIFDFGGQERFKPLIPQFLEGADGALLLFDCTRFFSFEKLEEWDDLLREKAGQIPKILVACKSDLLDGTDKSEIVSKESIDEFIKKKGLDGFFYTSALENYNILKVIHELTRLLLKINKLDVILI